MLKQLKWNAIFSSVAMIVAGVLLVLFPQTSASLLCTIIGIVALVVGAGEIIAYLSMDTKTMMYRNDLLTGILILVAGLVAIFKQGMLADLIPIILGFVIVVSGLIKLQNASIARRIGYEGASSYTFLSVISIIVGLVVMFFLSGRMATTTIFTIIGIGLIYSGASDLYVTLFLNGKYRKFMKKFEEEKNKVIEAEVIEERESE